MKHMFYKTFAMIALTSLGCGYSAHADQAETAPIAKEASASSKFKVSKEQVPAAALETIKKFSRNAKIDYYAVKKVGNTDIFRGVFTRNNHKFNVQATADGRLVKKEKHITFDELPNNIKEIVSNEFSDTSSLRFEREHVVIYDIAPAGGNQPHLRVTTIGQKVQIQGAR